ncbi:FadR family transcriptional regulator [Lichenibacterium minor]|jgi:DNA-binding FadR family transcriptional regulator|uniref:FadR family transcriptional regulator n=1 Tax=Lichenibacterium minor TaxID=2316528 RepID=A0A4Q2U2K5_9HYPH|nr:FCD domain-containing protein [Lichenibacterium minor]RYC30723.1 FadR family transcriptional regulator [Lichenibacterium minor]
METAPLPNPPSAAAAGLRALVLELGRFPDRPLPTERDLSSRFGVGRRAIRQALAELAAEGRVWRRQGKGTFPGPAPAVVVPTVHRMAARTSFVEVMEVRLSIEPELARLAAERATPEQAALIGSLARRTVAQTVDRPPPEIEDWDGALHRAVAEAAGNRLFLDLFVMVDRIRRDPAWQGARAGVRTPDRLRRSADEHLAMADAIARRDPAEAARVMRHHIGTLRDALVAGAGDA